MTISRANMGSQMKGGTMYKKKPVKKKMVGGILPALAKKKGFDIPMGILPELAKKEGFDMSMGVLPGIAKKAGVKAPRMLGIAGLASGKKMAKGGRVRGDGCAVRGKTKGTMR